MFQTVKHYHLWEGCSEYLFLNLAATGMFSWLTPKFFNSLGPSYHVTFRVRERVRRKVCFLWDHLWHQWPTRTPQLPRPRSRQARTPKEADRWGCTSPILPCGICLFRGWMELRQLPSWERMSGTEGLDLDTPEEIAKGVLWSFGF